MKEIGARKWTAVGVVTAALVLWAVSATGLAEAQAPTMRAHLVGPVLVGDGQTLRIEYSNIFGTKSVPIRFAFFNPVNGALVGGLKNAMVDPGKGDMGAYTNDSGVATSVVGVAWLAEPRPDPILSAQLVGSGGVVWLAEPRPAERAVLVWLTAAAGAGAMPRVGVPPGAVRNSGLT